jgi:excisionase family DNA binding protein
MSTLTRLAASADDVDPIAVPPRVAMQLLCIGETTLFKLLKNGELQSVQIGRSRRILMTSIKRLAGETE